MSETIPEPTTPPAGAGTETAPPAADPPAQEITDWKAEARKWEKRAKDNSGAVDELDKVRKASMSDQEKAVAAAKAEGATEASKTFGAKLAAAKFEAALAVKGLDLGEDVLELIDASKFVTDKGDVDEDAIKKAVNKLAKIAAAKSGPGTSGGDFGGGNGAGGAKDRPKNLREAYARTQT